MKKLRLVALAAGLLFLSLRAAAQYHSFHNGYGYDASGFYGGYRKISAQTLWLKHRSWALCAGFGGSSAPPSFGPFVHDSLITYSQGVLRPFVLIIRNTDTAVKAVPFVLNGTVVIYPNTNPPLPYQATYPVRKDCDRCTKSPITFIGAWEMLSRRNEFSGDSSFSSIPTQTSIFPLLPTSPQPVVDTATNALTIFHGTPDIFLDSNFSQQLRNVLPFGGVNLSDPILYFHRWTISRAVLFSRIYAFQSSPNISSPEPFNSQVIMGMRGKPAYYNLGLGDPGAGQRDSVTVVTEAMRVRTQMWHPNTAAYFFNGTAAAVQEIKNYLRDSTQDVAYYPGYSHSQPFGGGGGPGNASFQLNPGTGQLFFQAQDTGVYLLSFRIREWRGGQLLGDAPYYRVAYIADSTGAARTPTLVIPDEVSPGAQYDAAEPSISVCPGQSLSFKIKSGSAEPGARIAMVTARPGEALPPGATISFSGQGTASVTATVSWTPGPADTGYYYYWADVADTACGHGGFHYSKGFRIRVRKTVGAAAGSALICPGQSTTLAASGTPPFSWSTLPGGSPAAPGCVSCVTTLVSPAVSTRYLLTASGAICAGTDTVTVTVLQAFSLKARPDTNFCNNPPASLLISAAPQYNASLIGAVPQPPLSYSWTAGPGGQLGGNSGQSVTVNNPGVAAYYVVTATDSKGCFSRKDTVTITKCLGVGEAGKEGAVFQLWPNPAGGWLEARYGGEEPGEFRILDASGRLRLFEQLPAGRNTLRWSVAGWARGLYQYELVRKGHPRLTGKLLLW